MQLSFKTWVARALESGGVLAFAEALMRSRRKVVFTLHRVLPQEELSECYNLHLAISPESFDHFLTWLRSRYAVVSFDELIDDRPLRSRTAACSITFDDGWEDNYRVAFPILQAHGVSALIYLVTGLVGSSELLPEERLWQMLRTASSERRALIAARLPGGDGSAGPVAALKELPYSNKLALLRELQPEEDRPVVKFMDWDQVASMRKVGHSFGSHTVSHIILPREDDATVLQELTTSKKHLESRLGLSEIHFAFPNGSFDERSVAAVRAAGYRSAVTTSSGAVRLRHDPFLIPRLAMDNTVVNDPSGAFSTARARYTIARGMVGSAGAADY